MWARRWLRTGEAAKAVNVELGDGAYNAAWAAGGALSLDEAVGEALTQEGDRASHALQRGPLTAREWEVALLVAKGLTNRRIGEKLVITEGTAALHVRHILNKLGFHSRAQIAAWVATRP
jgi:non-specific serine/threonine protein kinase